MVSPFIVLSVLFIVLPVLAAGWFDLVLLSVCCLNVWSLEWNPTLNWTILAPPLHQPFSCVVQSCWAPFWSYLYVYLYDARQPTPSLNLPRDYTKKLASQTGWLTDFSLVEEPLRHEETAGLQVCCINIPHMPWNLLHSQTHWSVPTISSNIVKVHAPIILFFVLDSAPIVAHSCADSLLCGPSQPGSSKGNKTTNIFHYSCQWEYKSERGALQIVPSSLES